MWWVWIRTSLRAPKAKKKRRYINIMHGHCTNCHITLHFITLAFYWFVVFICHKELSIWFKFREFINDTVEIKSPSFLIFIHKSYIFDRLYPFSPHTSIYPPTTPLSLFLFPLNLLISLLHFLFVVPIFTTHPSISISQFTLS